MRTRTRTSTMIALRARRQAWEMACDIAYPHVDVPSPIPPGQSDPGASPAGDPDDSDWRDAVTVFPPNPQPLPRWAEWLIAAWLIVFVVITVVLLAAH